ncbi:PAS domain S-box protein [Brevibacillus sp. GCM10020057]|uniref:PAS domain S-box protein n=1 Tax=Brevibacillus sp. GCM10020057 TaxID=3317327 RepID=UPI00362F317A
MVLPEDWKPYEQQFLDNISDGYIAFDRHWNVISVNAKGCLLFHCHRDELIGKSAYDRHWKFSDTLFYKKMHEVAESGKEVVFNEYSPRLGKWLEVKALPMEEGVYALFREAAPGMQADAVEAQYYHSLFLQHSDAMYALDLNGCYISVNPAMERLTGYSRAELLNRHFRMHVEPEDLPHAMRYFESAARGAVQHFEARCRTRTGQQVMLRVMIVPIRVNGAIDGVCGIAQDITEQKRTEQLLLESQQRYQSLMTYNSDGVTAFDLAGTYKEVNPAFERLTGYKKEELLQLSFRDLISEDDYEHSRVIWNTLVREGVPFTVSQKLAHKSGHLIEVTTHNIPIIVNGEVTGYFTIWRDTSGQKRSEEILRQSDKLAVVGQLAAAVAHEVRNPLTSLKGFTQLLQHQFPTADQSYFDIMKGELERIELISGELLVLAKPKPEHFEQRCVNQLIREVVTLLESQANMSMVEIELSLAPQLPLLYCDANQLKQVFVNLIKNGIESMHDGGKLQVVTKRQHRHLFLSFIDEGCGIPQDKLDKIGDPFFTTKEKGTGLGMMITQQIIRHHKGELQLESEWGKGTTVNVLLPLENE